MRFRWRLAKAKRRIMTKEDRIERMKSFAYGNCKIDNDAITREIVDQAFNLWREEYGEEH
jgi:hypothetical protein